MGLARLVALGVNGLVTKSKVVLSAEMLELVAIEYEELLRVLESDNAAWQINTLAFRICNAETSRLAKATCTDSLDRQDEYKAELTPWYAFYLGIHARDKNNPTHILITVVRSRLFGRQGWEAFLLTCGSSKKHASLQERKSGLLHHHSKRNLAQPQFELNTPIRCGWNVSR